MRLVEDNPVYVVLLADQEEARLDFISYGRLSRQSTLESSLYPVKQQQGGWSQRRYQARADERIEARHPDPTKQGTNILRSVYDPVRAAILDALAVERERDLALECVLRGQVALPGDRPASSSPFRGIDGDGFADPNGIAHVYYGAADTVVGLATATVAELLAACHQ